MRAGMVGMQLDPLELGAWDKLSTVNTSGPVPSSWANGARGNLVRGRGRRTSVPI